MGGITGHCRSFSKPFRFYFCVTFGLLACFLLSACGDGNSAKPASKEQSDSILEQARGYAHWKSKTVFEVIETGEIIEFDIVVNARNREVIGSYDGVIIPVVMFKATSNGAAISIQPATHYLRDGFDEPRKRTVVHPAPATMWYPDVNDLSYGYRYVTSQAFRSPNAKIRFISYEVEPATPEEFKAWTEKTLAEYKQVGAIPGPFGCIFNGKGAFGPDGCFGKRNKANNDGHNIAFPSHTASFAMKGAISDEAISMIKELDLPSDQRYFCLRTAGVDTPARETNIINRLEAIDRANGLGPRQGGKASKVEHSYRMSVRHGISKSIMDQHYELDARVARGEAEQVERWGRALGAPKDETTHFTPVTDVLPVVFGPNNSPNYFDYNPKYSDPSIVYIVTDPDWRGFGVAKPIEAPIPDWLKVYSYDGEYENIYVVDGQIVCRASNSGKTTVTKILDTRDNAVIGIWGL